MSLALETIAYSHNRNAIELDFAKGWTPEAEGPWAGFDGPVDEDGIACEITLPAWRVIAFHALFRDVSERLYTLLGDTVERYVATRLGVRWEFS